MYLSAWRLLLCSYVVTGLGLSQFSSVWQALLERPPAVQGCRGCGARRTAAEQTLSDAEITAIRIELIKKQILDKLRLKEPPKLFSTPPSLPKPLADWEASSSDTEVSVNKDVNVFYGETNQVILLPKEVNLKCNSAMRKLSSCMLFQLPSQLGPEDIQVAELWVHKGRTENDRINHIFRISEVPHWSNKDITESRKILEITDTYNEEEWIKIHMTWTVKNWLDNGEHVHYVYIDCTTCSPEVNQTDIAENGKNKSYLTIHINSTKKNHRVKRNVNCSPGVSECCREELYVSFAEIGWDNWILQPRGYHAYYCRGSCTNAPALTVTGSHYNTIIQRLLHRNGHLTREAELSPCCTATRLSSVQLLYTDGRQIITKKTLPNMVVESCGCT